MFLCYIIQLNRVVRWYRTARRHRVGKAHAMHVITTTIWAFPLGPGIPEDEILRNRQGRIIDDASAEAAAAEAVTIARGRGRPSLSRSGESPLLRVRLSRELDGAVTRAAERAGTSRAAWVRHALAQAARKAS